ncbi:hypothetical protein FACS1894181_05590 [Bacteroidia bacterium]|nr:hypothetical protein FACS1894181_05590 [Bacteroidia bacterium]
MEIISKVLKVGTTEVKYKKYGSESGPTYTEAKSAIFMIKYEDGTKDVFSSAQERTTTSRPQQQQQASRPATQQTSRSWNPVARETTARETAAAGFKSLEFYFKNNPKISIRTINN